jgi:hypothetical protein
VRKLQSSDECFGINLPLHTEDAAI